MLDLHTSGFSMPLGASIYPPPPHHFRGAEQAWAVYEADADAVASMLPPGLRADSDPPVCSAWVCWYPWTTFGPYHESFIMVRVEVAGERYWYQPVIFTDNEVPLAAGREIWGFAKKLAVMRWDWGGAAGGGLRAEQLVFTADRPAANRILTFTMAMDRLADPASAEGLPVLSFRYLPSAAVGRRPAAAELIRLDVESTVRSAGALGPDFWSGRASVVMNSRSEVDPWHRFAPTRMLGGFLAVSDFSLPLGTVVKDYVAEGCFDGSTV